MTCLGGGWEGILLSTENSVVLPHWDKEYGLFSRAEFLLLTGGLVNIPGVLQYNRFEDHRVLCVVRKLFIMNDNRVEEFLKFP